MITHSPTPWRKGSEYSTLQDEIEDADGRTIAAVWTRRSSAGHDYKSKMIPSPCAIDDPTGMMNLLMFLRSPQLRDSLRLCVDLLDDSNVRHYVGTELGEMSRLHAALNAASDALHGLPE
ncbi:MAG: hypothetical protein IAG10_16125 [Planctomycetaceae bacterium]|nr:hypothetical protein [Planctomycetaceae bacterium]